MLMTGMSRRWWMRYLSTGRRTLTIPWRTGFPDIESEEKSELNAQKAALGWIVPVPPFAHLITFAFHLLFCELKVELLCGMIFYNRKTGLNLTETY